MSNIVCGGMCEPICKQCNRMADIVAEQNQADWEDAGHFDYSPTDLPGNPYPSLLDNKEIKRF